MRRLSFLVLSLVWLGVHSMPVQSQEVPTVPREWSSAERAVWAAVEEGWQALRAEDIDRFMATFHPQFLGWNMTRPAPIDVEGERRGTEAFLAQYDWDSYTIEPVAIRIVGPDAIVHYRYREALRPAAGGAVAGEHGRATQVLRRVGGRWKTLTIMSGATPEGE